ncbi:hypothetical protein [Enterococcus sp. HY326]|uniref:hypothetical protein n=1 Tax=Enterococcus sp. HY326 TaxID=2971265 RepID=UPI0022404D15|nr:hypothetical protein [Enterococcus sp. HY326]
MRKLVPNEKLDLLYSLVLFLIGVILLLLVKFIYPSIGFFSFFILFNLSCLPSAFRRKRQIKNIQQLAAKLDLSLAEVRRMLNLHQYDLTDWSFNGSFVSVRKIYRLEYLLEKEYLLTFGTEFVYQKPNEKVSHKPA